MPLGSQRFSMLATTQLCGTGHTPLHCGNEAPHATGVDVEVGVGVTVAVGAGVGVGVGAQGSK